MDSGGIFRIKGRNNARTEENDVINSINEIRELMRLVHERLNYTSDELITDSLNYELLALKTKHKYFTKKAKEMKIKSMRR